MHKIGRVAPRVFIEIQIGVTRKMPVIDGE